MSFSEFKRTEKFDHGKLVDPGRIYIPAPIREVLNFNVGDEFKLLVDEEEKSILIKTK